ncbi:MAG: translation initiation factor IF-2 [Candidatus Omnitrophica bacterium]|nr:translation initiation factor IF-2 [Candidatus Omnitrophota bacterium]
MKVRDLAKKFKMQGKDFIALLEKNVGIKGKKTVSALSDEEIEKIDRYIESKLKEMKEKETREKKETEKKERKRKVPEKPEKKVVSKEKKKEAPARKTTKTKKEEIAQKTKPSPVKTKEKITEREKEKIIKKPVKEPVEVSTTIAGVKEENVTLPVREKVFLEGTENIKQLAEKLKTPANEIVKHFLIRGIMVNINQCPGKENIKNLCEYLGLEAEFYIPAVEEKPVEVKEKLLVPRAPVVTIMGHVDHGKTTILDTIRKSRIAEKEYGQITQKIGAYKLDTPKGSIVFLDTPGHEAFTAMRARGAMITDIVILVVAADEGIKPQTIEAINHARSANVPIIVAINKIDKPNLNLDKVKKQLAEHKLTPEEWGGDTIFVNVSGLTGQGIEELIDMIILLGEMLELKASPEGKAEGVVIESYIDKTKGPIINILIRNGTLKTGEYFVAGNVKGKVRAIIDDWGRRLESAGPSTPVEILGGEGVATPGEIFKVVESEKVAREIIEKMNKTTTGKEVVARKITLENLYKEIQEGELKELKLILKTDYVGTIEAIKNIIEKIPTKEVKIDIIHSETGAISESDILLASASNAIVLGFNVPLLQKAEELAKSEGVEVRTYRIIYELADEIRKAVEGMLEPEEKEVLSGQALVKKVFHLSDNTSVAGCLVVNGVIVRNSIAKIVRNGTVIHQGLITSLKRFKENVKEVKQNTECGIGIEKFVDFQEGDIIQSYIKTKVARKI